MMGAPDWRRDGADWPNRAASRFVEAGGLRWHVQDSGGPDRPCLLLLHGAGAATHSWRDLLPLLARDFRVVAPDLPGHGFTGHPAAAAMGVAGMAKLVAALAHALAIQPVAVVGHSAGAAIAARAALDGMLAPDAIVALNGALLPIAGPAGFIFPAAARLLAANPVVPMLFSVGSAEFGGVDRLLASTGSRIDAAGARFYRRLLGRPGHVAGALRMMSRWDLQSLALRRLRVPVTLMAGTQDGMVPPDQARQAAVLLPDARLVRLHGLGHLAHEEAPDLVAGLIVNAVGPAAMVEACA